MRAILNITRLKMSSAIAFSALAGFILKEGSLNLKAFFVYTGVLLLAGAATALNQIQERKQDALMSRTKDRPLPAGEINLKVAIIAVIIMGFGGITLLYYLTTPITALLGFLNIIWYNAIYTPLKKITGFVVIVGAVTGALPPIMGWTAAGGKLTDPIILFIAAFFFLWQIPHFLLLLLKYKNDYKKAGFHSLTSELNDDQVKIIVFAWVLGTSLITLLFPLFRIISQPVLIAFILIINVVLIGFFYRSVFTEKEKYNIRKAFGSLYLYQMAILAILIFQALI